MKFSDMMNKPLNKQGVVTESSNTLDVSAEPFGFGFEDTNIDVIGGMMPQVGLTGDDDESDDTEEKCETEDAELSDEQAERVDANIKLIATPIMLGDELGEEEIKEFTESVDSDNAINSGFFTERTIVKMDKHAKKARLKKVAVFAIAKEKKDPLFKKLTFIWKIERKLEATLMKKYNSQAESRAKKYLANASKSPVKVIRNMASKIIKK